MPRWTLILIATALAAPAHTADPSEACASLGVLGVAVAEAHNRGASRAEALRAVERDLPAQTPAAARAILRQVVESAYQSDAHGLVGSPVLYGLVIENACRKTLAEAQP